MSELNIKTVLPELKKQVLILWEDLLERATNNPEVSAKLQEAYHQIEKSGRVGEPFEVWREDYLDQVAVAWILACLFVRFMEDNGLIGECYLAGEAERRKLAEDTHELYFREHPHESDRDYFEHVFREVGDIPACRELFGRDKTQLWAVGLSGDAAMRLLAFWREIDAEGGHLKRPFKVAEGDTRFLGDLYQDLSERARKKYALLQTPVFIEEFILDRTLTPAIDVFGLEQVRMIDPTCGSGHFLLGGFQRLFRLWMTRENNEIAAAQKALNGVWGVDLNPFAVAIARFRLIVAAMNACGIRRLREAPAWNIHLATGDSLLHGRRFRDHESDTGPQRTFDTEDIFRDELKHHYEVEDAEALHRILGQQYHAVVGNPPYITVKDRSVSELYRVRYPSSSGKYSLSVPFMERFFDLAVKGDGTPQQGAGFVGQITSNSFMKRGFGKKLIEEFIQRWNLTHVVDTAGTYIPGHNSEGTPTVILFGKNQSPVCDTVRTVLGIRGEPATPDDPSKGLVWTAIVNQIDRSGTESEWVSAADFSREKFHHHPWSIGGGGAAELKTRIDEERDAIVADLAREVGITSVTGEDDLYVVPQRTDLSRLRVEKSRTLVMGDNVRDWQITDLPHAVWLYDEGFRLLDLADLPATARMLWTCRANISRRRRFGTPMLERGLTWYEWQELYPAKLRSPLTITFAFVSTHNHFALEFGASVFKQTAPVIKLRNNLDPDAHILLLGVLNSSLGCFWLKAVSQAKSSFIEAWETRYEFDSTKVKQFPIPSQKPSQLPTAIVNSSTAMQEQSPSATLASWGGPGGAALRERLASACDQATSHRRKLIAWQEELDWQIYEAFGLVEAASPLSSASVSLQEGEAMDAIPTEGIEFGERAFEILLARRMTMGEVQTAWFERHGSKPITEVPRHWPAAYRELVERRICRIADNQNIRLIEQPEYKRRWSTESWDNQLKRALREFLLTRLEQYFFGGQRMGTSESTETGSMDEIEKLRENLSAGREPVLVSAHRLADVVHGDHRFLEVAAIYRGRHDFDLAGLVSELVEAESVPFLPVLRYKPSGLRTRELWEKTWELQRREDKGDKVGDIKVPPKYCGADFLKADYWRLRGKLDVPKERWVSYPHCETDGDHSLVIGWAGWDHMQQATALVAYYDARKREGWSAERLVPLLAGLDQLIPWIHQWHPEVDPDFGETAGQSYQTLLEQDAHELGLTLEEIRGWAPPEKTTAKRKKAKV